jgi:hypothetical protein
VENGSIQPDWARDKMQDAADVLDKLKIMVENDDAVVEGSPVGLRMIDIGSSSVPAVVREPPTISEGIPAAHQVAPPAANTSHREEPELKAALGANATKSDSTVDSNKSCSVEPKRPETLLVMKNNDDHSTTSTISEEQQDRPTAVVVAALPSKQTTILGLTDDLMKLYSEKQKPAARKLHDALSKADHDILFRAQIAKAIELEVERNPDFLMMVQMSTEDKRLEFIKSLPWSVSTRNNNQDPTLPAKRPRQCLKAPTTMTSPPLIVVTPGNKRKRGRPRKVHP